VAGGAEFLAATAVVGAQQMLAPQHLQKLPCLVASGKVFISGLSRLLLLYGPHRSENSYKSAYFLFIRIASCLIGCLIG
jgi:hypothetical protein